MLRGETKYRPLAAIGSRPQLGRHHELPRDCQGDVVPGFFYSWRYRYAVRVLTPASCVKLRSVDKQHHSVPRTPPQYKRCERVGPSAPMEVAYPRRAPRGWK